MTTTKLLKRLSFASLPISVGLLFVSSAFAADFSQAELLAMGQGLFEQPGSNSCMYCHGIDGKGGKVAAAAHLHTPKTWKGYKALGGDAAFGKDKAKFIEALTKASVHLIANGAVAHNGTYKEPGFDLSKGGGPYNAQMLGVGGAPSQQWIKKYESRGVNKDLASKAAFEYVKTLDTQGVFK